MSTKWQIESSTMDKMKIRHVAAQISHIVEKLVMNRWFIIYVFIQKGFQYLYYKHTNVSLSEGDIGSKEGKTGDSIEAW